MGPDEMREIASIMKRVLSNVTPTLTASGKKSLTKYILDETILNEAQQRVEALLSKHPLYPELDLNIVNQEA
jgi:glycine hydroxymethyltransferase